MKQAVGILIVVSAVGAAAPAPAHSHPREMGITIEPTFVGLPAIADDNSSPTLALAAGGAVGFEFMPDKYLSITGRLGYVHSVGSSKIGQATFLDSSGFPNTGNYFFTQDAAFALAGLRIETPIWWLPVQFFLGAQGGVAVVIQDQRELRNKDGINYEIQLPTLVRPEPLIGLSGGIFGRVSDHVRLNAEGTLYVMPIGRTLIGFGVTLGVTFLFFV